MPTNQVHSLDAKPKTVACCFHVGPSGGPARAIERPDIIFKVFQFPADKIPRIDGKTDDWNIVPENYVIGTDQLVDTEAATRSIPSNCEVRVKVGWVKGLNRLYFLYEAYQRLLGLFAQRPA